MKDYQSKLLFIFEKEKLDYFYNEWLDINGLYDLNHYTKLMGVYRSEPDTEKHTMNGASGKISFCSVEMQGIVVS